MTQLAENLIQNTISGTAEQKHQKTVLLRNWLSAALTSRGVIVLAFALYLLAGPVPRDSDVVATVLSFCLLALLALLAAAAVFGGLQLSHMLSIRLFWEKSAADEELLALRPVRMVGRLPRFRLPPLFRLSVRIHFSHAGVATAFHRISGSPAAESLIIEDLTFPHRGEWQVSRIDFACGDCLGFCSFEWEMRPEDGSAGVLISPASFSIDSLPVLSSCSRSGDELEDRHERRGEHFDLKQYHPSDGIKKILWKIFARRGELISRHPERAMSPEGEVVLFCLAAASEDHVCSAMLSYLRYCLELDLQVFAGCEGAGCGQAARTLEDCRALLIESVWETGGNTAEPVLKDLNALLKSCAEALPSARLERLVIFTSPQRLASRSGFEQLIRCGELLEAAGIMPVFFTVCRPGFKPESAAGPGPKRARLIPRIAAGLWNLLFSRDEEAAESTQFEFYPQFVNTCAGRNWEFVLR